MHTSAVTIDDLSHAYGERRALDGVTLTVRQGALYGLLGPNGGGKSTLFRILSTLIPTVRGRARVFDVDVGTRPAAIREMVGIVFQSVALDEELTVRENLRVHASLFGIGGARLDERLAVLLPMFGLAEREGERVDRLSGGLKRRVDLVRGLLHAPAVLLLDEPTAGLDPGARRAYWDVVDGLRRREETTLLLATHTMEEADRCDAVAILDNGRVVVQGTPDELKDAVGDETLWIECDEPAALAARMDAQLDVRAAIIGGRLQISDPNLRDLLPALFETFGGDVHSATIRRPTLEDVFMLHAGHGFQEASRDAVPEL